MSLRFWREDYLYFGEVLVGEKPFKACAFDRKGAWQKLKIKLGVIMENPTVVFKGVTCKVSKTHYQNGQIALVLDDATSGERFTTATSCLVNQEFNDGETAIKEYGGNEGIFEALMEAKIIEDTGVNGYSGFCVYPIVKVLI